LENILSIQSNHFFSGEELLIAGEIDFDDIMAQSQVLSPRNPSELEKLRSLVKQIDERVISAVFEIVKAGKIPILIGGGHNNAYGNIKGAALALNGKKGSINCINCDAHTDLRAMEGRHSGNGFSYAHHEGFLDKYAVVGVHENYLTARAEDKLRKEKKKLFISTYEDIFVREKYNFTSAIKKAILFTKNNFCGVELDLDAITNVPSSAKTSSGISPVQARQYVYQCGKNLNAVYFHIAEGAPVLAHKQADNKTGKLIGYLVTDFIKGVNEKPLRKRVRR
jgi:formiminoglutamase